MTEKVVEGVIPAQAGIRFSQQRAKEKLMDWRALCGEKLVTPEQALKLIQPTDRVFIAGLQSTPFTLCRALIEKRAELRGLHLNTLVSLFPWDVPGLDEYFHLES